MSTARNDITRALIKSRLNNNAYDSNYDAIFGKKKKSEPSEFVLSKRNDGPVPFPEWFDDAVSRNEIITYGMGKFGEGEVYCKIGSHEGEGGVRVDVGDTIGKDEATGQFYVAYAQTK